MASNIKGITIEIGGNTGPLQEALKGVNKTSRDLQSELRQVNAQLKLDPNNTVLLQQKQKLLAEAVSNTKEKLTTLKEAERQAEKQFQDGKIGEEKYRALQREVVKTETELKGLEKQAHNCNSALDKISEASEKVGAGAGKVSSAMMPTTVAIVGLGAAAGNLGSDLIESMNKVEVACGDGAQEVIKFSETTLESFGIAQGSALDMMAQFADMGTGMGLETQNANEMSMALVGLAGDLASFKNVKVEVAKTALNGIYTGETESLKQLGVVMTEANLQEYALSQGINKKVNEMTQAEKVQLRYNYVLDKTKNAQGDFANTSDGAANSMRVASEAIKEAGASIGIMLTPYIAKAAQYISDLVKRFIDLDDGTKKTIIGIIAVIAAIAPVAKLIQGVTTIVGGATKAVKAVSGAVKIYKGVATTGTVASKALAAAMTFLTGPVGIVIMIITLLVGAFIYLWNTSDEFRNFWINLWEKIKEITANVVDAILIFFKETIPNALESLKNFIVGIYEFVRGIFENIKTTIENILNNVITFISNVWNSIKEIFNSSLNAILNFINEKFGWMIQAVSIIFEGIKTYFQGVWEVYKNIFLGAILLILDLVTGNFTKLKEDASNIFNNLKEAFNMIWEGIKMIFQGAIDFIVGYLTMAWNGIVNIATIIWNGIKDFFIGLWTAIKETATAAWDGFKNTIVNICTNISSTIVSIWNVILDFFRNLPGTLYNLGVTIFSNLKNGITSILNTLGSVISNGFQSAINFITNLPSQAYTWGVHFIEGLVNGIKSMIGKVQDAVVGVAEKIRSFLHFTVPDEGPLTDYETWMPDFMEGLAKGINNSKNLVTNAIKGLSTDMSIGVKYGLEGAKSEARIIENNRTNEVKVTNNFYNKVESPYEMSKASRKVFKDLKFT
ncbi:hypothetical protein [uncultured Clostridium sp.]|jgi:conserved hypothetical protein|uniref:phage tail protein n=1 Tax=uncultured Clostridium sp. TaxID=59620 RepID=UPI0020545614|nr:hypothetical protein [uncultured Clostridium sp.]DAK99855.1 MAG TPA: minor tail protein [Caudoviricetes sp.]